MQRWNTHDYLEPTPADDGEWVKAEDAIALERERDELRAALALALNAMVRIKKFGDMNVYGLGANSPFVMLWDAVDKAKALLGEGESK